MGREGGFLKSNSKFLKYLSEKLEYLSPIKIKLISIFAITFEHHLSAEQH
jgi:hypothetical protein